MKIKNILFASLYLLCFSGQILAEEVVKDEVLTFEQKRDIICREGFKNDLDKCKESNMTPQNIDAKYNLYLVMLDRSAKRYKKSSNKLKYFDSKNRERLLTKVDNTNYEALAYAIKNDWGYKRFGGIYAGNLIREFDVDTFNPQEKEFYRQVFEYKFESPFTVEEISRLEYLASEYMEQSSGFFGDLEEMNFTKDFLGNLDLIEELLKMDVYQLFANMVLCYSDDVNRQKLLETTMYDYMNFFILLKKYGKTNDEIWALIKDMPYYYRIGENVYENTKFMNSLSLEDFDNIKFYNKKTYDDFIAFRYLIKLSNEYGLNDDVLEKIWKDTDKMKNIALIENDLESGVYQYYVENLYYNRLGCNFEEAYKLYKTMHKTNYFSLDDIEKIFNTQTYPCYSFNTLYYGTKTQKLNKILKKKKITNEEKVFLVKKSFKYKRATFKQTIDDIFCKRIIGTFTGYPMMFLFQTEPLYIHYVK